MCVIENVVISLEKTTLALQVFLCDIYCDFLKKNYKIAYNVVTFTLKKYNFLRPVLYYKKKIKITCNRPA